LTHNNDVSEKWWCPIQPYDEDVAGTANDALVFATYHDCMCACCKEGECPELKYNLFMVGLYKCKLTHSLRAPGSNP
jgi:hypothetical protein